MTLASRIAHFSSLNAVSFRPSAVSTWLSRDQTYRELVYRPLQFQKRSPHFIAAHDETLSVAMGVNNPDCSPVGIISGVRPRFDATGAILTRLFGGFTPDFPHSISGKEFKK